MRLHLVRHARPIVANGICYGSTDLAVAPEEHDRTLSKLATVLPAHAPVYSSPLRRCGELAQRLAAALGSGEVRFDARLAEMDFGSWEMQAWETIPRAAVDAWAADMCAFRPGGGESVLGMASRIRAFLDALPRRGHEHVIVVCHGGTIRLMEACLRHSSLEAAALAAARSGRTVAYGELLVLDC